MYHWWLNGEKGREIGDNREERQKTKDERREGNEESLAAGTLTSIRVTNLHTDPKEEADAGHEGPFRDDHRSFATILVYSTYSTDTRQNPIRI
jgi:hypothetical protein